MHWNIISTTSRSSHLPASNGQAERAVKMLKKLLKNSEDRFETLLAYWTIPLPWCGQSPVELLMRRKILITLLVPTSTLVPEWPYVKEFQRESGTFKQHWKNDFDHCYWVRNLLEILDSTNIWVRLGGSLIAGRTITSAGTPTFYILQTPIGEIRRYSNKLNIQPPLTADTQFTANMPQPDHSKSEIASRQPNMTRSHTGTNITPSYRLL